MKEKPFYYQWVGAFIRWKIAHPNATLDQLAKEAAEADRMYRTGLRRQGFPEDDKLVDAIEFVSDIKLRMKERADAETKKQQWRTLYK